MCIHSKWQVYAKTLVQLAKLNSYLLRKVEGKKKKTREVLGIGGLQVTLEMETTEPFSLLQAALSIPFTSDLCRTASKIMND